MLLINENKRRVLDLTQVKRFSMVTIVLNMIQFEAEKFETRTMPTPNMKGKEVIYWIRVTTDDKRLVGDLRRFLEGAAHFIDLRVPSAFISTKTELERFRIIPEKSSTSGESVSGKELKGKGNRLVEERTAEETVKNTIRLEIILRRTLPETPEKMTQSPYG